MSEWREYKLKQLTIKIGSGATPRGGSNSYKEAGISLIRSQNVLDFGFSESGLAFIDEEQANQLKNVEVLSNDILLNITGDSVARCCIVPDKYLPARVNQHVSIIRLISEKANQQFIFYYLQYLKPELLISAEIGATRNAITKGMIEEIEISLPPSPRTTRHRLHPQQFRRQDRPAAPPKCHAGKTGGDAVSTVVCGGGGGGVGGRKVI